MWGAQLLKVVIYTVNQLPSVAAVRVGLNKV